MATAFGQSPAASGDVGSQLASAAINIGQAFAVAQAAKSTGKAVSSNSGSLLAIVGIGAVVVIGGIIAIVVVLKK